MRTVAKLLSGRVAWALLAVVVAVTLVLGSIHPGPRGDAARISHLDSIIKCPSCEDLSIAQSNAPTAIGLRAIVAADVQAGQSDAQIEQYAVSRYGPSVLLEPGGGTGSVAWAVPLVALVLAAGAVSTFLWRRRRPSARPASEDEALVAAALGRRATPEGAR
jgi:cytochrome c-type biogenesis protein CcmH